MSEFDKFSLCKLFWNCEQNYFNYISTSVSSFSTVSFLMQKSTVSWISFGSTETFQTSFLYNPSCLLPQCSAPWPGWDYFKIACEHFKLVQVCLEKQQVQKFTASVNKWKQEVANKTRNIGQRAFSNEQKPVPRTFKIMQITQKSRIDQYGIIPRPFFKFLNIYSKKNINNPS